MAKKNENIRGMHIKPHTEGTSNEISFSVLHARRKDYLGDDTTSPVFSVPKRRIPKSFFVFGIAIIVVISLVVGIGSLTVNFFKEQAGMRGNLVTMLHGIEEADDSIIPFDELVTEQMSSDVSELDAADAEERLENLRSSLDEAKVTLTNAKSAAEELETQLVTPQEKEAANQAILTINARLSMIDQGLIIVEETTKATRAAKLLDAGWNDLLDGDEFARGAALAITDISPEQARRSQEMSEQALTLFQSSYDAIYEADQLFMELDIEDFLTYLQLRIDAQRQAIASDEAYLEQTKDAAQQANDRYNQLENEAAEIAEGLDSTELSRIEEFLYARIHNELSDYATQRQQAGGADQILRDYLGVTSK